MADALTTQCGGPTPSSSLKAKESTAKMVPKSETIEQTRIQSGIFSNTIQLQVGTSHHFTVHKTLLEKVPFFELCLRNGMREDLTSNIKLPEDDPKAVEDMLGFLYFGKPSLDRYNLSEDMNINQTAPESLWQRLHRLYLLADKIDFEELQNSIMDIHREVGKNNVVPTSYLMQMESELRLDCLLIKYLVAKVARNITNWKGFSHKPDQVMTEAQVLDWVERGGRLAREVFRLVALQFKQHPSLAAKCVWHIHKRTAPCNDGTDSKEQEGKDKDSNTKAA